MGLPTHQQHRPILPGAMLGVLGGGQLGRMFVHSAQQLGFRCMVFDPDPNCPAAQVADLQLCAQFTDVSALSEFAKQCAAITIEFENVPATALSRLALASQVAPPASAVAIAQDRALEKAHFLSCGLPVAPHFVIDHRSDLTQVPDHLLPGILKTTTLGYDGKGQASVHSRKNLENSWEKLQGRSGTRCILEMKLPLQSECSVVVARGFNGQMVCLPPQKNTHRNGILALTEVADGIIDLQIQQSALESARSIAEKLSYVGVLCVEFFILEPGPLRDQLGPLVVNEIAPRPHNSGHHSMNSCDVSQFELQVRCLAGLPLVQPRQHSCAAMLNLLGDLWFKSASSQDIRQPAFDKVLGIAGAHLHLYGKSEPRVGRKMGHLNITASDMDSVRQRTIEAAKILGIAEFDPN